MYSSSVTVLRPFKAPSSTAEYREHPHRPLILFATKDNEPVHAMMPWLRRAIRGLASNATWELPFLHSRRSWGSLPGTCTYWRLKYNADGREIPRSQWHAINAMRQTEKQLLHEGLRLWSLEGKSG